MGFYDDMAATALRLLDQFGQAVTINRTTDESTDPVTFVVTAGTDAELATTGILKLYPDRTVDGTRILASDRELVLSDEQEPLITDTLTIDDQPWSVVDIKTVSPAGTDVVYFVQVRR